MTDPLMSKGVRAHLEQPTELSKAVDRLRVAAGYLICIRGHHYGGNIRRDLEVVLAALPGLGWPQEPRMEFAISLLKRWAYPDGNVPLEQTKAFLDEIAQLALSVPAPQEPAQ